MPSDPPIPQPIALCITFSGLCLLASDTGDPDKRGHRLHVLLMKPPASMPHFPRIVYDCMYAEPNTGCDSGQLACVNLEGARLEISDGYPICLKVPYQCIPLHSISSEITTLDRKYVTADAPQFAVAQVTMFSGAANGAGQGANFNVPNKPSFAPRVMTNWVRWRIDGLTGTAVDGKYGLTLDLLPFGTNSKRQSIRLYPKNGEIKIVVLNVDIDDLPPTLGYTAPHGGEKADHFPAYYPPFGSAHPVTPIIESAVSKTNDFPINTTLPTQCDDRGPRGVHTVTCITAYVDVGEY